MVDEIISVTDSVGKQYAHQLSDKDDITTITLNRCLRSIFETFVSQYEDTSNKVFNLESEEEEQLLKFRRGPSGELDAEDDMNMGFVSDDGVVITEGRGNFVDGNKKVVEAVTLDYVNYPGQIYRSIRLLGSTTAAQKIDVRYSDDLDPELPGRYSGEPWFLGKASDSSDSSFGVVGRLWNHSAAVNEVTLRAIDTDQTLSSGGWCANVSDVVPVTSYEAETAMAEFAPTVDALYADEFPYALFNLLGSGKNMWSGKYSVPGYSSVEISYTNVLLNSNIGMSLGKVEVMRSSDEYQTVRLDIDLKSSVLYGMCPRSLLFTYFGNGVCNGVTAVSYPNGTRERPFAVSEVLTPTVSQTGDFRFAITDLTKTTYGEREFFNVSTGFRKQSGGISNISVSNRSYEMYFAVLFDIETWDPERDYYKYDEVMYVDSRYISNVDNNTSTPGTNNDWTLAPKGASK